MLNVEQVEKTARKAGRVASSILGLECQYTIILINDPDVQRDAQLDTSKLEIQINLAKLEPFSLEVVPIESNNDTEESRLLSENYRHLMKICYLVFHEMRHIYQIQAVNVYTINKQLGSHMVRPLEPDKKAAQWLEEMKEGCTVPVQLRDTEADANDFAYYLTNRYPTAQPLKQTNRRIGAMKRKYDKTPIPDGY